MNDKNTPNYYWVEVVATIVYIMNKSPTTVVHRVTVDLFQLKVFRCIAYVHILDENRTKLDSKAKKCIFIGYSL